MSDHVTLSALALELGLDKSGLRKYALKNHFVPVQIRTLESRGQSMLALSSEDAEALRELRQQQGFGPGTGEVLDTGTGFFYVVQLVPELSPNRLKLGYTNGLDGRLSAHRTAAPTAILLKSWPCQKVWEPAAIASATRVESRPLSNEVFDCDDAGRLVERVDAFFALMPSVS